MEKGGDLVPETVPYLEIKDGGYAVVVGKTRERVYLLASGTRGYGATQTLLFHRPTVRTVTALVVSEDTTKGQILLCVEIPANAADDGSDLNAYVDPLAKIEPVDLFSRLPFKGENVSVHVDGQDIHSQITEIRKVPRNLLRYKIDNPAAYQWKGSPVLSEGRSLIGYISKDGSVIPASLDFLYRTIQSCEKHLGDNRLTFTDLAADYIKYKMARTATAYKTIDLGILGLYNHENGGVAILLCPNAVSPEGVLTEMTYAPGETILPTWFDSDPKFRRDYQKYSIGVITEATFTNIVTSKRAELSFGHANFQFVLPSIGYFADLEKEVIMDVIWNDNNQTIPKTYIFRPATVKDTYQGMVLQRRNYQMSVLIRDMPMNPLLSLPPGITITDRQQFLKGLAWSSQKDSIAESDFRGVFFGIC
jgi:hypothetical protein